LVVTDVLGHPVPQRR